MVAIKNHEADRFVGSPPAGIFAFLVFGADAGLVSERVGKLLARAVADPQDPFQLARLDAERLADDPARLIDEAQTVPLFGGRRAILIEAGARNIGAAIEPVLALRPVDCTVIIAAGALKRDAPLRMLIESAPGGAAIECFPDGIDDLKRLIEAEARAAGLAIAADAREALVHLLGANRLTTRGELAKLMLYAHGAGRVTLEDVEAVVADASAAPVDGAIDGAYLGDFAAIEATLTRVFAEGGDPGFVLGAALRHGVLLQRARLDVEAHKSVAAAVESATRFGFFFKRKPAFERQLNGWSAAALGRAIGGLADAIPRCRREPRLGQTIAARALWSVALTAQRRTT